MKIQSFNYKTIKEYIDLDTDSDIDILIPKRKNEGIKQSNHSQSKTKSGNINLNLAAPGSLAGHTSLAWLSLIHTAYLLCSGQLHFTSTTVFGRPPMVLASQIHWGIHCNEVPSTMASLSLSSGTLSLQHGARL